MNILSCFHISYNITKCIGSLSIGLFVSPIQAETALFKLLKGSCQVSHSYQGATLICCLCYLIYLSPQSCFASGTVLPISARFSFQLVLLNRFIRFVVLEALTALIELHFNFALILHLTELSRFKPQVFHLIQVFSFI